MSSITTSKLFAKRKYASNQFVFLPKNTKPGCFTYSGSLRRKFNLILTLTFAGLISSCGGSGSNTPNPPPTVQSEWKAGEFESSNTYKSFCEAPRPGDEHPDMLGTTIDENNWLRSWTNDTYLWFDEVVDRDPARYETLPYFDLLRTTATDSIGEPKDNFHFTFDSEAYAQLSQSGVSAGYGFESINVSRNPNKILVAYTQPGSTAENAGIGRGAQILSVDGVDVASPTTEEVDAILAGLSPESLGENHSFEILDLGAVQPRTVHLVSRSITSVPVQNVSTIETDSGKVGYLTFNEHIATSEPLLIDAITFLSDESVSDLILDLRYNGGGRLAIASQLSYMIAGESNINGAFFEQLRFNSKHPVFNPVTEERNDPIPFVDYVINAPPASLGDPLPSLNLERVYVLSTDDTCSASESVINGLRGIGVEVILIGDTTCGKPYGFYPQDNCGTTYFTIQFQTENALGFGDYARGFSPAQAFSLGSVPLPGCLVADDFNSALGDPEEALLSTALSYRASGECPTPTSSALNNRKLEKSTPDSSVSRLDLPSKPLWLQNRIVENTNE